ncbi:type I-G CRISPR-associated helicase/endonuclease Cas3g [Thioalkalivibrio paradoxus]|uniref:Type I-U CRISPR-associated helicase/endonuclease Cas3 n=1 Tax=Thioalkalivibrio paradoxus ARh 1 TaxID=713585 RepID=W0DMN2_9GAMM|nr:type I-U CRISPR-associated helicase/endonuclease Cas3 [Thioalkalivibrio paradoxus]AHE99849.1 hypothetical protein THITH_01670 [Thioalkalivibrio paradoxus ARh 1]
MDVERPPVLEFASTFQRISGFSPYPWQERLFDQLIAGRLPRGVALPTASGKTSIVLIYLLALAAGAALPRRLVYIVDRRAIVDQTTNAVAQWTQAVCALPELANRFRALAAFPDPEQPVRIGTLRGGMTDTGQWRLDPSAPTVVIGTVDMIGSRLLFSGYGDGRNRRSLHAGLLGVGTTVILDEAHLNEPFAQTLRQIEASNPGLEGHRFTTLTMSATPRGGAASSLAEADTRHPVLGLRLQAVKRLHRHEVAARAERLPKIVELLAGFEQGAILAFVRSAQEAQKLHSRLSKRLGKAHAGSVGILTGTLRGHERERLTRTELWRRFAQPRPEDDSLPPVWLIATAAAEVGVDLDADHLVMDLVPLDSLIQRLGRVNRSGRSSLATVHLVYSPEDIQPKASKKEGWEQATVRAQAATLEILRRHSNLNPMALLALSPELRAQASLPDPRHIPLAAERITLLAATGARLNLPPIEPFLRGLSDEPEWAETQILWRHDVELLTAAGASACAEALTFLRPRPREVLKLPTAQAARAIAALAERAGPFPLIRIDLQGQVHVDLVTEAADPTGYRRFRYATVVLPTRIGGLSEAGFLDPDAAGMPVADLADDDDGVRFEVTAGDPGTPPEWVRTAARWELPLHDLEDEDAEPRWWVYARRQVSELALDADTDLSRLGPAAVRLPEHNAAVGCAAERIGQALRLPEWMVAALHDAGAWHDAGKGRRIWQRAAGNRRSEPVAKAARGSFRPALLGGYRHEFGSLADAIREFPVPTNEHDALRRDLTLHLIAAHHGHARPGFAEPRQWDPELPVAAAAALAMEVERRYDDLQRRFGPWGLAWLEALLKCADARVSSGLPIGEAP